MKFLLCLWWEKIIFLCSVFLFGAHLVLWLVFVARGQQWQGNQAAANSACWLCEYQCPAWMHRSAFFIRLEVKLNLVHISSQVELVMFFLRHLQPHFKVKTEKHKGEDFRHWFAHPILTRGIIMCCGKLTRLPEAACVKVPNFLVASYGEGTELSLGKISFSFWSSPKLPSWFWESCLTSLHCPVYIMNLRCSLGLEAHPSASG